MQGMARILLIFFLLFLGIALLLFSALPGPLAVRHAEAATVTVAWDPNTEPDLGGYKLYYGKASGTYESVIDVGNQTTYNLSDLEDGKTYYFALAAYSIDGFKSEFSSELKYPEPFSATISLSAGWNLISLPIEPLNPTITALTETLSPCVGEIFTCEHDTCVSYFPSQPDHNTLSTMEPGRGYWVEMACPGEMIVLGNRTTNSIPLTIGENLVGYNSLTPLPVSEALSSIANKYTMVWAYKDDQWIFHDPSDETGSTLKVLSPGSAYFIEEVTEETTWNLPYIGY
jgi:hypothetical protein